jgi:hypothetical protein
MRPAVKPGFLLALLLTLALLAGCAKQDNSPAKPATLSFTVTNTGTKTGSCGNPAKAVPLYIVDVLMRNDGAAAVSGGNYDFYAHDWSRDDYPLCPVDEPVIEAGSSKPVSLTFYKPSSENCLSVKDIQLQQRVGGEWLTVATQMSGFKDPCVGTH